MGLLKLRGTLDGAQFWPTGQSDSDTTKVIVTVHGNSFQFSDDGVTHFKTTHAFDDARVKGKSGTKTAIGQHGQVTIRLQGIDAPELHYPLPPLGNKAGLLAEQRDAYRVLEKVEYRQYRGESSRRPSAIVARPGHVACEVTRGFPRPTKSSTRTAGSSATSAWSATARTVLNDWLVVNGWASRRSTSR
jgi:endonuclease YncB( thermonuclease family)